MAARGLPAGLDRLRDSTAEASRRFAADMRLLAELAAQVPRCPHDDRGATPWTSFRREVAAARTLSDQGAAAEIRAAEALTTNLTRTMGLLETGRITVQRARALVTELERYDGTLATRIDAQLAERAAGLPVWRIVQEVRRAAATADPDDAAERTAQGNAARRVELQPQDDDQATVTLFGPAVPLTRWHSTLDTRARALEQAGDPRTLDQLRFDLATSSYPCTSHHPTDPSSPPADPPDPSTDPSADRDRAAAGLRPAFVEPADSDCRLRRPVQADITVPVETALGLSNEPGWLDGYGWLTAPTCRLLLVDAELRRVCLQTGAGAVVDVADRDLRPPPTYTGLREALVDMVLGDITPHPVASRVEDQHDPSPPLRQHVQRRDRFCDGPTGTRARAGTCQLDHNTPHPHGPTAAWNLAARSTRTHQLKHHGWTPLRTPTSTIWFSPAGQVVETPRHSQPPPGIDTDPDGRPAVLPDPELLAWTDLAQLQPRTHDDTPPWTAGLPRDTTTWTQLGDDEPPF